MHCNSPISSHLLSSPLSVFSFFFLYMKLPYFWDLSDVSVAIDKDSYSGQAVVHGHLNGIKDGR